MDTDVATLDDLVKLKEEMRHEVLAELQEMRGYLNGRIDALQDRMDRDQGDGR